MNRLRPTCFIHIQESRGFMFKKAILLGTLAALGTAGGMTLNTQNVVAKAYRSPKTLKGFKYTHSTINNLKIILINMFGFCNI